MRNVNYSSVRSHQLWDECPVSIQPQIGLENSRTSIKSDGFSSFSPMGMQLDPRLAARMGYKFKTGHGVFVGVATGSQGVKLKFNDPRARRPTYSSTGRGLQLFIVWKVGINIAPNQ